MRRVVGVAALVLGLGCAEPPPDPAAVATSAQPPPTADESAAGKAVAFELPIPDLFPEGIARDPRDGTFYVSSVRHGTVLRLAADGRPIGEAGADGRFVRDGAHGMVGTVGLRVDPARDLLWVASGRGAQTRTAAAADERSGVYALHLADGALAGRYLAPADGEAHLINDVALSPDGRVFATDTGFDAVWEVVPGEPELVLFGRSRAIASANGLAASLDGLHLYVAHRRGIVRLPLDGSGGAVVEGADVAGIDGLYAVPGGLLAVQNGEGRNRIVVFRLAADGLTVTGTEVLAEDEPSFDTPTTCAVAAGAAWCVAGSHLLRSIDELPDLGPSAVLRLALP